MGQAVSTWSTQAGNALGTGATDLFGQAMPNAPNLQTYQPQSTGQADSAAFSGMQQINNNNPYLQNQAEYQALEQQGLNNPYAAGQQASANAAGQQYTQAGTQAVNSANAIQGGVQSLLPYMSQVANTAMDPQNALYNQQSQLAGQQAAVTNAQNGVAGSPYGASVANNANNNFNINWQNNQLQRQTAGLGAAGSALGSASAAANNAANTANTGAGMTNQGGQLPDSAYIQNIANAGNALNSYGQSQMNANANTQTAVGDFQNYMNEGASQSDEQANMNQQNFVNNSNLVSAANAGISGLFGNTLGGSMNAYGANSGGGNPGGSSGGYGDGSQGIGQSNADYFANGNDNAANTDPTSNQGLFSSLFDV